MRATLRKVHRWLALALSVLWLSQALTGLLLVYSWELGDAMVEGEHVPFDVAALGARIEAVEASPGGRVVSSLWDTGSSNHRYYLYVDDEEGNKQVMRVDGAGRMLHERPYGEGLIPSAASLHHTLSAGDTGKTIVGISGMFLLSSIIVGLVLAWPARAGQWRMILWPDAARPGAARRYAWHRALGLWFAAPSVVFLSAGVLLTFESGLKGLLELDVTPPELQDVQPPGAAGPIAPGRALAIALEQFPGSTLGGAYLPKAAAPWYMVRVRQAEEWRRVYGKTVVYVAEADGRVLRTEDALNASARKAFIDNLFPVHTGEALGTAGRLLSLATGTWLLSMLVLGIGLWWARRPNTSA